MSLTLFESKQYILNTSQMFEEQRDAASSEAAYEKLFSFDTALIAEITRKILQILERYPNLNGSHMGENLAKIRDGLSRLSPDQVTKEFQLFSKVVDYPVVTAITQDEPLKVNSSLLVFNSRSTRAVWECENASDLLHLENWTSDELLRVVHYLETEELLTTTENNWRILCMADHLEIPKLAKAVEMNLMKEFSTLEKMDSSVMRKVVTMLNEPLLVRYSPLKQKLESLISKFFVNAFEQEGLPSNYYEIKKEVKKLKTAIHLNLSSRNLTDFHLLQVKKLPITSLNLHNCPKLSLKSNQIINQITTLWSIDLSGNGWVTNAYINGFTSLKKLKKLDLVGTDVTS